MGETTTGSRGKASTVNPIDRQEDLTVIRERVGENGDLLRQNGALLRQLVELLLPRAESDGPPVHELLALIVAQLQQTLLMVQQHSADMDVLLDHLLGENRSRSRATG